MGSARITHFPGALGSRLDGAIVALWDVVVHRSWSSQNLKRKVEPSLFVNSAEFLCELGVLRLFAGDKNTNPKNAEGA